MSNILIAEIFILIAFIGYFMIEMWLIVQFGEEMLRACFSLDRTDPQVVLKGFFGKLVIELIEKRRGKNDCKKL